MHDYGHVVAARCIGGTKQHISGILARLRSETSSHMIDANPFNVRPIVHTHESTHTRTQCRSNEVLLHRSTRQTSIRPEFFEVLTRGVVWK